MSVCLCVCVCVYRLLLPTLITSVLMMLTDYITLFFSCHGLKIYGAWLNKYHNTDLWLFRILVKLYIQSSEKPRAALLLPLELRGLSGSQVLLMKCIWLILIDHHFWLFVCLKAFRCVLMPKGQRKTQKQELQLKNYRPQLACLFTVQIHGSHFSIVQPRSKPQAVWNAVMRHEESCAQIPTSPN